MARKSIDLALLKELDEAFVESQLQKPLDYFSTRSSSVEENEQQDLEELILEKSVPVSKAKTFAIIASVTCVTGMGSFLAGLVTVALPIIIVDLRLDQNLFLWCVKIAII